MKKYRILNVNVTYSSYDYFVEKVLVKAKKNRPFKMAPVASHPITKSYFNKNLKRAFDDFDMVLPDGQSLVWAANLLYKANIKERVYGPELFNRIVRRCQEESVRVILYGNHTNVLKNKIKREFKRLKITAFEDLKGRRIDMSMLKYLILKLKKYKRSILFIGIGSPAQHIFLAELEGIRIPAVAVGAAFDFKAGFKKQAPDWIQNSGLEWLFRLTTEPKRLWKRYIIDAPLFVILVCLRKLSLIKG